MTVGSALVQLGRHRGIAADGASAFGLSGEGGSTRAKQRDCADRSPGQHKRGPPPCTNAQPSAAGRLLPVVGRVPAFDDLPAEHARVDSGRKRGSAIAESAPERTA